jgi:hypothetical protein
MWQEAVCNQKVRGSRPLGFLPLHRRNRPIHQDRGRKTGGADAAPPVRLRALFGVLHDHLLYTPAERLLDPIPGRRPDPLPRRAERHFARGSAARRRGVRMSLTRSARPILSAAQAEGLPLTPNQHQNLPNRGPARLRRGDQKRASNPYGCVYVRSSVLARAGGPISLGS